MNKNVHESLLQRKTVSRIVAAFVVLCMVLSTSPSLGVRAEEPEPNPEYIYSVSIDGLQSAEEFDAFYALTTGEAVSGSAVSFKPVASESKWFNEWGGGVGIDVTEDVIEMRNADAELTDENITLWFKFVEKEITPEKPVKVFAAAMCRTLDGWDITEEWDIMGTDNIEFLEGDCSQICHHNTLNNMTNGYCFALSYPSEGDIKAKDYIENELFAYGDITGDGSVTVDDMKVGISTELCAKYFWDNGGILDGDFGIDFPSQVIDRIDVTEAGTYSALNETNDTVTLNKFSYKMDLGYDHDGNKVICEGNAYELRTTDDVLIMDGSELYIRDVVMRNDSDFSADVKFGNYDECHAAYVSVNNTDLSNIKINGNGFTTFSGENPSNSTVFMAESQNRQFAEIFRGEESFGEYPDINWPDDRTTPVRVISKSNVYAIVEPYAEDPDSIIHSREIKSDAVCQTGEGQYKEVFAGYKSLLITSLFDITSEPEYEKFDALSYTDIKNVELADTSMAEAVEVCMRDAEDVRQGFIITFKSNYYDEVPVLVTYSKEGQPDVTKELLIKRIALKVHYEYLGDPETMENPQPFFFDRDNENPGLSVEYDYNAGQQILIWATYYHADPADGRNLKAFLTKEDGSIEIKNSSYTRSLGQNMADETYFILGFAPSKEWDGYSWAGNIQHQNVGAWDAMVLNSGFDDSEAFGGAQFGHGAGVHWDGNIDWTF